MANRSIVNKYVKFQIEYEEGIKGVQHFNIRILKYSRTRITRHVNSLNEKRRVIRGDELSVVTEKIKKFISGNVRWKNF